MGLQCSMVGLAWPRPGQLGLLASCLRLVPAAKQMSPGVRSPQTTLNRFMARPTICCFQCHKLREPWFLSRGLPSLPRELWLTARARFSTPQASVYSGPVSLRNRDWRIMPLKRLGNKPGNFSSLQPPHCTSYKAWIHGNFQARNTLESTALKCWYVTIHWCACSLALLSEDCPDLNSQSY